MDCNFQFSKYLYYLNKKKDISSVFHMYRTDNYDYGNMWVDKVSKPVDVNKLS